MATHWAIDFGTANTTVYSDRHGGRPRVVHMPKLAKLEPLTQTPVIPSAVCVLDTDASRVLIGQEALSFNFDGQATGYSRGFKRFVDTEATRTMAQVGGVRFTCEELVSFYFRELLLKLAEESGEPVTDLTLTVPTDFYETYRANLRAAVTAGRRSSRTMWQRFLGWIGVRRHRLNLRFIDEPVAAALGYGVSLAREATIVSVDFGAGTLDMACIRIEPGRAAKTGRCHVLGKQALRIGGNDVDQWIIEEFAPSRLQQLKEWRVSLNWEAERVKLLASSNERAFFKFRDKVYGEINLQKLENVLEKHEVYDRIHETAGRLLEEIETRHGIKREEIDEVLLEGGSTLLPRFRKTVGEVFGLDRVREWLPFESVARGACIYAGGLEVEDFIHHDYALRMLDETGNQVAYELLIPRGTRYPTSDDFVTRYYSANRPGQSELSLYICEVGRVAGRPVTWRQQGDGSARFVPSAGEEHAFCICLNERSAPLALQPPARGTEPRLRVTYGVNEERWLCVTVHDLAVKSDLLADEPVVKLR